MPPLTCLLVVMCSPESPGRTTVTQHLIQQNQWWVNCTKTSAACKKVGVIIWSENIARSVHSGFWCRNLQIQQTKRNNGYLSSQCKVLLIKCEQIIRPSGPEINSAEFVSTYNVLLRTKQVWWIFKSLRFNKISF